MTDPCVQGERITRIEGKVNSIEIELTKEFATLNAGVKTLIEAGAKYVSNERFQIIQILVYGFAGIVLTSVIGALIAKVISK